MNAKDSTAITLSAESLLQHESFVRSVVRGLLSDDGATDDVLQETWLTALHRRPRSVGSLRSWLASIARNLARDSRRAEARRSAREKHVARPEAIEAVDQAYERLAVQRDVVGGVLELPEPYKSVVILRYYHGLTPTAIAQRLDAKPATVRTQLMRAHGLLRGELDSRYGEERSWAALLLAPLHPGRVTGGPFGKQALLFGSALAMTVPPLLYLALRGPTTEANGIVPAAVTAADPSASSPIVPAAGIAPVGRTPVEPVGSDGPYGALDLTLTWWDGTPAADVGVRLIPFGERQPAQSFLWRQTNEQGQLRVGRIHAGPVAVAVERLGLGGTVRLDVAAGSENARTLEIPRGVDVEGVVLDEEDVPVAGAELWTFPDAPTGSAFRIGSSAPDGSFVLRSVSGGSEVCATSATRGCSSMYALDELEVTGADTRRVELRLDGTSFSVSGSVLDPEGNAVVGALVHTLCRGNRGEGRLPGFMTPTDAAGRFQFSGREPYMLVAVAPGFALKREGIQLVEGAAHIDVLLDRGLSLSGTVVIPDGSPASGATVRVDLDFISRFYSLYVAVDEAGDYLLEQVPAGLVSARASIRQEDRPYTANARHEGQVGDVLKWDVSFGTGPAIRGRAQDDQGNPCVGWTVEAISRTPVHREVVTDAEGLFEVAGLLEEPYEVSLFGPEDNPNLPRARIAGVFPGSEDLEFVVSGQTEPSGFLIGRLIDSTGEPLLPAQMWARRVDGHGSLNPRWDDEDHFRIGPLPSGEYELSISLPADLPSFMLGGVVLTEGAELDLGDILVPEPGSAELVVRRDDAAPLSEGATVFLVEAGIYHHVLSSEDGVTFVSEPMFPGTYSVKVQAQDAASTPGQLVEIKAGEVSRAEFEVAPGRFVQFSFAVPEGERLPRELTLRVTAEDGAQLLRTDGEPQAYNEREFLMVLGSLPLGTHSYSAAAADGWSATGEVEVLAGTEPRVQVEVQLGR